MSNFDPKAVKYFDEPVFDLKMVGIEGITTDTQNHVIRMVATLGTYNLNGCEFFIKLSVKGSFPIFTPSNEMMAKNHLLHDEIFEKNKLTISNIFNEKSCYFAFNRTDIEKYFDCDGVLYFVNNNENKMLFLSNEELRKIRNDVKDVLSKFKEMFFSEKLKGMQQFKQSLINGWNGNE